MPKVKFRVADRKRRQGGEASESWHSREVCLTSQNAKEPYCVARSLDPVMWQSLETLKEESCCHDSIELS